MTIIRATLNHVFRVASMCNFTGVGAKIMGGMDRTPVESKAMNIKCKGFGARLRECSMISCDGAYIVLKGTKILKLIVSKWPIRKFAWFQNMKFMGWERSPNTSCMRG